MAVEAPCEFLDGEHLCVVVFEHWDRFWLEVESQEVSKGQGHPYIGV